MYYSENPDLNEKIVTTAFDQQEYRVNCRKIKGKYYIKGVDCQLVNNRWYKVDGGLITFDYEFNSWKIKNEKMINGIVSFNGDEPVFGLFTPNPYNNVPVRCMKVVIQRIRIEYHINKIPFGMSDEVYCSTVGIAPAVLKKEREEIKTAPAYKEVKKTVMTEEVALSEQILIDNGYVEDASCGMWVHPKNLDASQKRQLNTITNIFDPRGKGYNIEDNAAEFHLKCDLYAKYNTPITKKARIFARYLGDITWGAEIECILGYLPTYLQNRYGVVVCRDGSLKAADGTQGSEYTTIPVSGAKGLVSLHYACQHIAKRNIIDRHCAFHLHIGNIPTTRTFIVTLYKLILSIQEEMFSLFAYYKNDEPKYAGKEKNYCNKLFRLGIENCNSSCKEDYNNYINTAYNRIFSFLLEKGTPNKLYNRKNRNHPKQYKWERHNRYFWVNFMNVLFSKRNTVEFRLHTGTTNSQKAINWLFICNAIVKTAMCRTKDILSGKVLTLNDVLSYYPDTFKTEHSRFLFNYLLNYINERKRRMAQDLKDFDYLSLSELDEDKDYTYTFEGVKDLI